MQEQQLRTAAEKRAIIAKKNSLNIKDIKDRALQGKGKVPADKCEFSHI